MEELKMTILNCIDMIDETTNYFYQQKSNEGYSSLLNVIDNLSKVIVLIEQLKSANTLLPIDEQSLLMVCQEALKAMEEKDTVLLSDILEYEMKGLLNQLL